ncbi:hypothetical protein FOXG_13108 [Fusarium oxysporum f. sp. lycopersici 4287]|uniref:Uncharacterized protein n=2 Tax=Fusarium oxysporum TaxID=5507 RepID=A0A0J9VTQ5_FUSO4|nr:hypothetical protein FOXG_13108 [Fusarium oxysporum f. sp. lycopersici 4287]KNB14198.1 hypothetical protein FOXG_13108 [Fusarium oxysporum f. sp. lycopersici 4287]
MTIIEFLHKHFFYGLDCPWENAKLTFNKGCRFANVVLTEEGVRTKGYLWRFVGEISTAQFRNYIQTRKRKRNRQPIKRPLDWLAEQLADECPVLSLRLGEILFERQVPLTAAKKWMLNMADKVEEAIMQGKLLHTAELLDSDTLGVAVFISETEDTNTNYNSDGSTKMGSEMSVDSDDHDEGLTSSFVMISRNLLTGTVVLLAASLANAGPCHPSSIASSSTVITSVSETATSSFEGEAATSTASIDATQTATTATESESESETGTTFIVETTSTVSSVETTTTALVDTTTAAPIGNGANVGKLAGYSTSGDFSLVIVAETTLAEENGISPLDCEIIDGNGFQMLQCQYGDKGVADLWTCAGHLTLVKPGVDFTSMCARAATAYKLGYIQVVDY